jgi:hypothetical protein
MVQDLNPPASSAFPFPLGSHTRSSQAVTGLIPPLRSEGMIREVGPTVLGQNAGLAILAKKLIQTYILAPVGIFLLGPLFALKFAPFICKRYTLTNRRLMIRHGLKPTPVKEVALADIDEVRFDPNQVDPFYVSGTLEIVSKGQVVLTLPGVPEPEGFRHAIVNAVNAWVPGKAAGGPYQSATTFK